MSVLDLSVLPLIVEAGPVEKKKRIEQKTAMLLVATQSLFGAFSHINHYCFLALQTSARFCRTSRVYLVQAV